MSDIPEGSLRCQRCSGVFEKDFFIENPLPDTPEEEQPRLCRDCFSVLRYKLMQEYLTKLKTRAPFMFIKERRQLSELICNFVKEFNTVKTLRLAETNEMYMYRKGIYVADAQTYIESLCREVLGELYTTTFFNEVVGKLRPDTFVDPSEFFSVNPEEIAVQNGILNLRTRELSPFDKDKIFLSKINAYYNPEAVCPRIKSFISDIVANENDIKTLQELIGYVLYRDAFMEKAFLFDGSGRNGKSKFLELIKIFIGPENSCSVPLQALNNKQFTASELHNKMLNIGGDIGNEKLRNTYVFKSLLGRDQISADRKFKSMIHFVNYAKLVFACNEVPVTYDQSDGFFDRWIIIKFPYKFVDQYVIDNAEEIDKSRLKLVNKKIIDEITTQEELNGLLNFALDGLSELFKNKKFTLNQTTKDVRKIWIMKSDSFSAFCDDFVVGEFGAEISKSKLKKIYSNFCIKNGVPVMNDIHIKKILENKYSVYSDRAKDEKRSLIWKNISVIPVIPDIPISPPREFRNPWPISEPHDSHDRYGRGSITAKFRGQKLTLNFLKNEVGLKQAEIDTLISHGDAIFITPEEVQFL